MSSRLPASLLALCALALTPLCARAQWTNQLIEEVREFSLTESAVQIDAQNRPHVFVGGDRVYHYWQDGGSWHSEVVDSHPRSGQRLRAAMGPSGDFHLVYDRIDLAPESTEHELNTTVTRRYATNLSGAWELEQVPLPPGDQATRYKTVTGLVVDASHVPHVMTFADDTSGVPAHLDLFLQSRTADGWTIERINDDRPASTAAGFAASTELAIDGSGRLHALWFTANSGSVQPVYSVRDGSGWHHEVVTVDGKTLVPAVDPSALLVDGAGAPHVVFINQTPADDGAWHLVHLERSDAGWRLDDLGLAAANHVTALDAAGRAHVVFSSQLANDPNTGQERFVGIHEWETDAGWVREEITPAGQSDLWWTVNLSLRIDALGRVVLADLLDQSPVTRRVALFQRDSGWTSELVAESGPIVFDTDYSFRPNGSRVGADVRIALREGGRRLVYTKGTQSTKVDVRRAVEQPDGSFAVESLPQTNEAGPVEAGSLAYRVGHADSGDVEHVVYVKNGIEEVRDDGAGPAARKVIGLPDVGASAQRRLAIDVDGGAFSDLEVLFQNGTGLGSNASLADVQTLGGALFLLSTVGPVPGLFGYERRTALGLASSLSPRARRYAVWVDMDNQRDVVRATNDGTGWKSEVIGSVPSDEFIGSHSFAVELDGTVHLAYERFTFSGLFGGYVPTGIAYGTNRCHGVFYTTDADPYVVPYDPTGLLGSRNPEITLDPNRNPHISYRRLADRSLGYAHVREGRFETETVVADTYSGEDSAIAVDADGTVSIAHHDPWGQDVSLATRAATPLEPTWDGCPPLPDSSQELSGSYVFTTPDGAFPLYDPAISVEESYGSIRAVFLLEHDAAGKIRVDGQGYCDPDSVVDARIQGSGKISGNGRRISVRRTLSLRDLDPATLPNARLRISRSEQIDPVTRQRAVSETVSGKIDGEKVKQARSFTDEVPSDTLGIHLLLDLSPDAKGISAMGQWITHGGPILLSGRGTWSPMDSSASLKLRGPKVSIQLDGLRLWRGEADGIHLRADRVTVRGLGQNVNADIGSAY